MNLIKVILIICFLLLLTWAFRNRARVGLRAGTRLVAVVLTAVAITSILNPNIPQHAADFLGVTRGTDLVLYLFIVVFVVSSLGTYFRFREQERRLTEVVRASAIRDAILSEGMPGTPSEDDGQARQVPEPEQ
jgi:hypothetical protein